MPFSNMHPQAKIGAPVVRSHMHHAEGECQHQMSSQTFSILQIVLGGANKEHSHKYLTSRETRITASVDLEKLGSSCRYHCFSPSGICNPLTENVWSTKIKSVANKQIFVFSHLGEIKLVCNACVKGCCLQS